MEKKKLAKPKDEHLLFIDRERTMLQTRTERDTNEARVIMSTEPVRGHLLALIDELVRQGIYLPQVEQEAAKLLIKIIGREIQKGDAYRGKKESSNLRAKR